LERHGLARQIFEEVNQWLSEARVLLREGSLVDATIIEAPSSTKNKTGERARTGLTYSFTTTAANEHDLNQAGWHIAEQPGRLKALKNTLVSTKSGFRRNT